MEPESRNSGVSTLADRPDRTGRPVAHDTPISIEDVGGQVREHQADEVLSQMRSGAPAITFPIPAEPSIPVDPATGHPPVELFYDSIADEFDDVMNMYDLERRLHIVFEVFLKGIDLRGRRLLDAGCGTGWFSRAACLRGADVTALDIGPRLLSHVREKCDAETVVGDVLNLDFDSDSFDVVISSECIEHTRFPQRAVRELIRVCKPGGLVAITSNNHTWYWLCALANRLDWRPYKGIENWPTWRDFHSWFTTENVSIVDRRGFHLFPFQIRMLQPLLRRMDAYGRSLGRFCVNQGILAIKQSKAPASQR
ncbi:MAG: class I SAM-dependent methyltransferase [Phycisphaerales bacterium]|nr:class I SAM-dependent methyltransferase [Phycisphaerales bacterium]MCB9855968.1 class I SAM-dependent methyltransferase [Phycisphaerales bacterium]